MSTRQMILSQLEKHPYACAEDLAVVLARTRANIQYHLHNLVQEGLLIPVQPPAAPAERGRPRAYFALAQGERPDNLAGLAQALIELYLKAIPAQEQDVALSSVAIRILPLLSGASAPTARLNRLVKELCLRGYQARWEAHAAGPEIVFRNCPYAALLPAHPELCRMDALLLQAHLGTPLLQKSQIQLPQITSCRFGV